MNYPEELTNTYDIYEQIGAGGGGTVYRATHKRLQKTVVLKKITNKDTSIEESRVEVDILKNLHHPYLPQVLDFIISSEGIYTVMDFIPGKSMRQMLDEGYVFTEKEVLKYARQVCDALDYLHSRAQSIVHGDIKPDNIMVTPAGDVCLIDFNISGVLEGKGAKTFGYTPGYAAPEQVAAFEAMRSSMAQNRTSANAGQQADNSATVMTGSGAGDTSATVLLGNQAGDDSATVLLGQEQVQQQASASGQVSAPQPENPPQGIIIDKRSDIFSLGATLYTLLTGKILDLSASHPEMPDISSGFMIVLAKSLERDPDKRYQDAGEMLKAIVQVHKKDKKYRRLLLKQELVSVAIMLLAAVSVFMIVEGRRKMAAEHLGYYYELADTLEEGAISGMEEEQFNSIYEEAVGMYPNYLDAYYYKAYYLFATGDYVNTTEYIAEVLTYTTEGASEMTANLYHLYAECFFRMEDYQNAKTYYQTALKYSDSNPSIYRDYAISLVYLDQVTEAEKVLEQAVSKDMAQAEVYMVQGEIERMSGNHEKALECLNGVLQETEDEYLIQRAYIVGSKTYADMGTAEALGQDVEWLNEGIKELSMSNRLLLYERLAQDYISLGEQTQDNANYEAAIGVFAEIKTMNWDTYLTYSNAIILCQRIGDLAKAEEWAQEMLAQYPENYVTYMRLAYLEIEKQNKKENADREYQTFEEYYKQAKEYYEQQTSGNVTNAEIQLLDNTYQQVVDGGWLK